MTKEEVIGVLRECAPSGDIAPKPLGEYVLSSASSDADFSAADSLHLQGPYLPEVGSHIVLTVHFESDAELRFEQNTAAKTLRIEERFLHAASKNEFKQEVDRFLAENSDYKAYLKRNDWRGTGIQRFGHDELEYFLAFDSWLVQVVQDDSKIMTCILEFFNERLSSVQCEESAL